MLTKYIYKRKIIWKKYAEEKKVSLMNVLPVYGAPKIKQSLTAIFFDLANINENRHLKFKDRWWCEYAVQSKRKIYMRKKSFQIALTELCEWLAGLLCWYSKGENIKKKFFKDAQSLKEFFSIAFT